MGLWWFAPNPCCFQREPKRTQPPNWGCANKKPCWTSGPCSGLKAADKRQRVGHETCSLPLYLLPLPLPLFRAWVQTIAGGGGGKILGGKRGKGKDITRGEGGKDLRWEEGERGEEILGGQSRQRIFKRGGGGGGGEGEVGNRS